MPSRENKPTSPKSKQILVEEGLFKIPSSPSFEDEEGNEIIGFKFRPW